MTKITRQAGPAAARLQQLLDEADKKVGKAGWFETAKYPDGTPVAYVAAIHEYGVLEKGIPPRPTIRPTMQTQKAQWMQIAQAGFAAALRGEGDVSATLEKITAKAAGDIRQAISKLKSPPLKAATVKARLRKKSGGKKQKFVSLTIAKPLVDTGTLLNTLTHVIEDKL